MRKRRYFEAYMGPLSLDAALEELVSECRVQRKLCMKYGFSGCVASFPVTRWRREYPYKLRRIEEECDIWAVRVDIVPNEGRNPLMLVRRARPYVELLSIRAVNRKVAAFAARDRRVDIVTLVPGVSPPLYRGDEKYLEKRGKLVEVRVSDIVDVNPVETARRLFEARRLLIRIGNRGKVILSSGGSTSYSPRDPRGIVAFGHLFLDLRPQILRAALSEYIEEIVETNRAKLSGYYVVEGVFVEGKEKIHDNTEE